MQMKEEEKEKKRLAAIERLMEITGNATLRFYNEKITREDAHDREYDFTEIEDVSPV
jgi:hypothetical protein